jgi:ABC-2 type transport system permease protein
MRNILAIWQRELKSYFVSPIAYAVLTVFLLISGVVFFRGLFDVFQYTVSQADGQRAQAIDLPGHVTRGLFQTMAVILLFVTPMLTMGLFSEEKRRGTIELLLTTPVGNLQSLMGKYLASITFLLFLLVSSGLTISILFIYGQPDWKPILSGYLGLILYGAALLAIGVFVSTLTENQIVAVVITFGISLLLLFITVFSASAVGLVKNVIDYLSLTSHLDQFLQGIIDTSHVIYYLSFTFVGLFLAYRSLESMRWKG